MRNLVPRGPFWHALEIGTPGQVQWHSGFEWLCKHNRLRPEPIRFFRLGFGHAQSDGKSANHGLSVLDLVRGLTAVKCVRLLKRRAFDRPPLLNARGNWLQKKQATKWLQIKFRGICFHFSGIRRKQAKVFTLNTALKGASLLYIFFNKEIISATIVNFLVEFTRS